MAPGDTNHQSLALVTFRMVSAENKKGRRARSSRLPVIPLSGNPISLTEGG